MTTTYRPATTADIPRMADLMNAQYARVHESSYFQWQFFESYYPTVCITAWDGKRLVSMFGIQKRRLTDGTVIGHLVDLLIDPEYRGQGIFARSYTLAVAHFDNLEAVSVLPNLNGKDACVKSLGMQSIAKIDDLVLHGKVAAPEKTLPSPVTHSPSLAFATDARFRRWRYEQSPLYRYTIMGTAVTKAFKDPKSGDEFGDIVDWTETPRPEAILTACNELLASGQKSVSTWALPHTERYAHVRQLGFKPLVRERYFCIRALHPSKDYLYDINQWQLVPADAEIY